MPDPIPQRITCISCRSGRSSIGMLVVLFALTIAIAVALRQSRGSEGRSGTAPGSDPISYVLGSPDAPLEILELVDFGCGVCASFASTTFPEVRARFIDTGRVRWRVIPLDIGSFPNSTEAMRAAACADEQRSFWLMHDVLYEERQRWMAATAPDMVFTGIARRIGLDERRFATCLNAESTRSRVAAQDRAARSHGVRGTPTFVIGDQVLPGAPPTGEFLRRIEAVLASAR